MSCNSLKRIGHTKPGLYSLKSENSDQPRLGFCKMDEVQGYPSQGLEDFQGFWSLTTNPGGVFFSVFQNSPDAANIGPGVRLTFNNVESNVGNSMDPSTGIFVAPVSGHYLFEFTALTGNLGTTTRTNVYKNDNFQQQICDGAGPWSNFNHVWQMNLAKNDRVHLYQVEGSLWNAENYFKIIWSGQLLLQTEF